MHRTFFNKVAVIVLIGVALYSSAGFLLAPRLFKNWLESTVAEHPEIRLQVQTVTFNPFTFRLTLTDITLHEAEDDRLLAISDVVARLDLTRIFAGTAIIRDAELLDVELATPADGEIVIAPRLHADSIDFDTSSHSTFVDGLRIERPRFRIKQDAAGQLNLPGWLVDLGIDPATTMITIRSAEIVDARASFVDQRTTPQVSLESDAINGMILRQGAGPRMTIDAELKGRLFESASGTYVARWHASEPHELASLNLVLQDLSLADVSPYVQAATGHEIRAGRLDLTLRYDVEKGQLNTSADLIVKHLRLGEHDTAAADELWPLALAVALLEDPAENIEVSLLPVSRALEADSTVTAALTGRLHNLVTALAAKPFREMAVLAGVPDEALNQAPFAPGSAEITPRTLTRVAALGAALAARRRLGLITYPAYDQVADRHALATQQVRLHVALATSAGLPGQAMEKPIDFSSAKVRTILDEFSGARLSATKRSAIADRFADRGSPYYGAVFEALVEHETVSATSLERLANYRAQSLVSALVAAGIPAARLKRSDDILATAADQDAVMLRLEATAISTAMQ